MDNDDDKGPRVLGVGLGLFILILLWSFAFIGILAFSRFSSFTATVISVMTILITAILLALPRVHPVDKSAEAAEADPDPKVELNVIYDKPFIGRTILTVVMVIFLIVSLVTSVLKHFSDQVYAVPIKKKSPVLLKNLERSQMQQ